MSQANQYDQVPYPDLSYVHTHPDRLATMSTLLGVAAAPVDTCRVLEIGCANGGNLLPMAYTLPKSQFVGIDASPRQIGSGQEAAQRIGLRNVTFHALDLRETPPELGQFDYIIAHGVYSWVAATVRDSLLAVCSRHLAQPASHTSVTIPIRDGIRRVWYASRCFFTWATRPTLIRRVRKGKEMVQFLADSVPQQHNAYAAVFQNYLRTLELDHKGTDDSFILHDELEEVNDPVYFYQFAQHAAQHGLQYLVEAELSNVLPHAFGVQAMAKLQEFAKDTIALEQYMDFLRNRMFRQTLLCHADVAVNRRLEPRALMQCRISSQAQMVVGSDEGASRTVAQFRSRNGATLSTDHPTTIAAMILLREQWPAALPFAQLLAAARERVAARQEEHMAAGSMPAAQETDDGLLLAANLLRAYGYSTHLVELHRFGAPVSLTVPLAPLASHIARYEAQRRNLVTNLWHVRVRLETVQQRLLLLLDGKRTIEELCSAFVDLGEDVLTADLQPRGAP